MIFDQDRFNAVTQKIFKTEAGKELMSMLVELYVDTPIFDESHAKMSWKEGRRDFILMMRDIQDDRSSS